MPNRPGTPPPVLYRYCSPNRVDILENLSLRFARPAEFNDTFDAHYLVPKAQGSKGISQRFKLRSKLGIACFTERPDNHLMWVHYADCHRGFVLGFDTSSPFFTSSNRVLRKVQYEDGPRVFEDADKHVAFYKATQWDYEEEWRLVGDFDSSAERLVEFEPGLITQIIIGHRMEAWQVARIMQWVTTYEMTHIKFFLSSPSNISWDLVNKQKRLSLCETCGGNGYCIEELPEAERR